MWSSSTCQLSTSRCFCSTFRKSVTVRLLRASTLHSKASCYIGLLYASCASAGVLHAFVPAPSHPHDFTAGQRHILLVPSHALLTKKNCALITKSNIMLQAITDIQGLEGCPNLSRLWLTENEISVIQGLNHCLQLRQLYLYSNHISCIEGLDNLSNLEVLACTALSSCLASLCLLAPQTMMLLHSQLLPFLHNKIVISLETLHPRQLFTVLLLLLLAIFISK